MSAKALFPLALSPTRERVARQDRVRGPPVRGPATTYKLPSKGIVVGLFSKAGKAMSKNALRFWVGLVILLHQMTD